MKSINVNNEQITRHNHHTRREKESRGTAREIDKKLTKNMKSRKDTTRRASHSKCIYSAPNQRNMLDRTETLKKTLNRVLIRKKKNKREGWTKNIFGVSKKKQSRDSKN